MMIFRCLQGLAPSYLADVCIPVCPSSVGGSCRQQGRIKLLTTVGQCCPIVLPFDLMEFNHIFLYINHIFLEWPK